MPIIDQEAVPPRNKILLAIATTSIVAGGLLVAALERRTPHVGYDFQYFLPRLIDVYLHQRQDGFWAIQWWTPSFGAGLPAFFNPQHTQFMLAQWLVPWLGPWGAAMVQAAVFNAFGSSMVVWICARRLNYTIGPSLLAGLTFATCGFMWEHTLMGHLSFHVFPLVAIVPEALHRSVPILRSIVWLALSVAVIVFGGGYTVIVIFGLNCLLLMCLLPWAWPGAYAFSDAVRRLALGAVAAIGAVAVKLGAVFLFLKSFPRLVDYSYNDHGLLAAPSLLWQLFGLRIYLGFTRWLPHFDNEFQPWKSHSEDVGYGLVTLGILVGGAVLLWRSRPNSARCAIRWPLAVATAGAIWIAAEFTLGGGLLWPFLKPLPFLRSLHENYRFTAAFSLPLALCVAPCWSAITTGRRTIWICCATVAAIVGTLVSVDPYWRVNPFNSWFSNYDITAIQSVWTRIQTAPDERFEITQVSDVHDDATFLAHASSWKPYEPIFGYGYGGPEFQITFPPGPIEPIGGGPETWRFHDPRRFIAPNLTTASRFSPWTGAAVNDLHRFLARHQPPWPLPATIRLATIITLLAIFILVVSGFWSAIHGKRN